MDLTDGKTALSPMELRKHNEAIFRRAGLWCSIEFRKTNSLQRWDPN